ncbi:MAG: N-6 DNA methylase [Leptospiraceae bacterium]|nr:N-6 DNA methylase [Leptospiraceae bacterium]
MRASLYTTAKKHGKLQLSRINLVATRPSIGANTSPKTVDAFIEQFCTESKIPTEMAKSLITVLGKSDVLGSLLQIRTEIKTELDKQGLFARESESTIYTKLEEFVNNHDQGNDLGIFTLGTQLTRGLRLLRLLDAKYDVVVANPPYLSKSKFSEDTSWIFPDGVNELYELFIYRILDLVNFNGYFGILSAQNFMFISQFEKLRKRLIEETCLDAFLHLGSDTFADVLNALGFIALVGRSNKYFEAQKTSILRLERIPYKFKTVYTLNQPPKRIYHFDQRKFAAIEGSPMIYWWTESFRNWYLGADKVGIAVNGLQTCDNTRFIRMVWEKNILNVYIEKANESFTQVNKKWVPYIHGAKGKRWFEPLQIIVLWENEGKEIKERVKDIKGGMIKYPEYYFKQGIAYSDISVNDFVCRLRKYRCIFDVTGSSIFLPNPERVQVELSSKIIPYVSTALNPTIHNQAGDVRRYPIPVVENWQDYIERARVLYDEEFSRDETNVEYLYE